jgi:hypothetical protein
VLQLFSQHIPIFAGKQPETVLLPLLLAAVRGKIEQPCFFFLTAWLVAGMC